MKVQDRKGGKTLAWLASVKNNMARAFTIMLCSV